MAFVWFTLVVSFCKLLTLGYFTDDQTQQTRSWGNCKKKIKKAEDKECRHTAHNFHFFSVTVLTQANAYQSTLFKCNRSHGGILNMIIGLLFSSNLHESAAHSCMYLVMSGNLFFIYFFAHVWCQVIVLRLSS